MSGEQRRFDDPRWNDEQTALDDHDETDEEDDDVEG